MPEDTTVAAAADPAPKPAFRRDVPAPQPAAAAPARPSLPDVVGAAQELAARVRAAQALGYRVQMGFAVEALGSIVVSATDRSEGAGAATVPVTVPKQGETIVQGA